MNFTLFNDPFPPSLIPVYSWSQEARQQLHAEPSPRVTKIFPYFDHGSFARLPTAIVKKVCFLHNNTKNGGRNLELPFLNYSRFSLKNLEKTPRLLKYNEIRNSNLKVFRSN